MLTDDARSETASSEDLVAHCWPVFKLGGMRSAPFGGVAPSIVSTFAREPDGHDTFAVAVLNLTVSDDLGDGLVVLRDGLGPVLMSNRLGIAASMLASDFERVAGVLEMNALRNAPVVLYGRTPASRTEEELQRNLVYRLRHVGAFMLHLWLIKDHAGHIELGFLGREDHSASNMIYGQNASLAGGAATSTTFSRTELETASEALESTELRGGSLASTQLRADTTRHERSTYFVQAARSSSDLALKVAQYCSALEALLGTGTSELIHRLSERAAVVLSSAPKERQDAYRCLKSAYDVRSKAVHGAAFRESKVVSLAKAAEDCDRMLRELLRRVRIDETFRAALESSDDKLDEFFLELLFGGRTVATTS